MPLIAIDPGNKTSGWVSFEPWPSEPGGLILERVGIDDNDRILRAFSHLDTTLGNSLYVAERVLVETPSPRGMPTAAEEMDTLIQIGRIIDTCEAQQLPWSMVFRGPVKLHLTGKVAANDSNIRQALIDRFGGDTIAVGGKKCKACKGKGWRGRKHDPCEVGTSDGDICWESVPGPLYGVTSHAWAALAVACYWVDAERPVIHTVTEYFKSGRSK